jgi:hypothetical protein
MKGRTYIRSSVGSIFRMNQQIRDSGRQYKCRRTASQSEVPVGGAC